MDAPHIGINVLDRPEKVVRFWQWLTDPSRQYVACDIESGSNPAGSELDIFKPGFHVRMMQFGDAKSGWAIPFQEWRGLVGGVFDWISENRIPHVWHNGIGFDAQALRQEGITIDPTCMHDTQIYAGLGGFAGEGRKLKSIAVREFGQWAGAGEAILKRAMNNANWTWTDIPMGWKPYPLYGVVDTVITAMLFEKWEPWRKQFGAHHDMEIAASVITNDMSRTGMMVNGEYLHDQILEYARQEEALLERARSMGWGSPSKDAEVRRILYEAGALDVDKVTEGGQISVDKKQLLNVEHPLAELVLKYRWVHRVRTSYLEKLMQMIGGELSPQRIHPKIWSMAARTGRMSVSDPPVQQFPANDRVVREAFIPDNPDHVMISADFSQIEMRAWAILNKDEKLMHMLNESDRTGEDFFVLVARDLYKEPNFQKSDKRRGPIKNTCVPLDTKILTQRGWLAHDEVVVGDQTVGFNDQTGKTEWTTIRNVLHYESSPVVEMGTKTWKVRCTPDHRWASTNIRRTQAPKWTTTAELQGASSPRSIVLSAPHDGPGYSITDSEAALLGWALSDGHIRVSPLDGPSSQGRNGQHQGCYMEIRQSKHNSVIEGLIAQQSCAAQVKRQSRGGKYTVFMFPFAWARDLCQRVGLLTTDGARPSSAVFASGFSSSQRDAALHSMHLADGIRFLYASDAWARDLYRAMVFFSGKSVRTHERIPDGVGWMRKINYEIRPLLPHVTTLKMTWEEQPPEPVWCVQTDLGSWTMNQDGLDMITGNCYATIFAGGDAKIAETAGLPLAQVQPVINALKREYSSFADAGQSMVNVSTDKGQKVFEIWTPNGRRFRVRDYKDKRVLPNWCTQGWAATILKDSAISCRAAGLGDYLRLAVHDELIFSVPRAEANDAAAEIEEIMSSQIDPKEFGVAIYAKPSIGECWADLK